MDTDFDKGVDRIGTACIKWDFRQQELGNPDVLPFSIADADFPMCRVVADALHARIDRGVLGYTDLDEAYLSSVVRWFDKRHDWKIQPEWITSTSGVVPAVNAAIAAFLKPGDKVVSQTPLYDPFESVIAANGCVSVHNELVREGNGSYRMGFDDLERKLADGVSMLLVCSPHNPVGRVWSEEELTRVRDLCRAYGVILVSDEIHWDLIMPGYKHVTLGVLTDESDRVVICTAPSKTFNIAGLETSNIVIANALLREKYQGWLYSRYMFCANTLGLTACAAAYDGGAQWVDEQNQYLASNAELVREFMRQRVPEAVVTPLEGTYLMWIDLTFLGRTSGELVAAILNRGAGVNSGAHYGRGGEGFIRLNIACPRRQLIQGLESIASAVAELRGVRA